MNAKPGVKRTTHPTRVLAAFLALLLVASGLAVAGAVRSPAGAAEAPVGTVVGGELVWGVKASFRSYVVGPPPSGAGGEIEVDGGASQASGNGVFTFPVVEGGEVEEPHAAASTEGSVHFTGHYEDEVPLLDLSISNIRVVVDGIEGVLIADVVSRPFNPTAEEPPAPVIYTDVDLVALDLTGIVPVDDIEDQSLTWTDVPTTLTEEGVAPFANFYTAGTVLDPVTFTLDLETATTEVSVTTGINPLGQTVTVTGTGFDPDANINGGQPPVPLGMPTGVYVVFGRFGDPWQPSEGAPSSARKVIDRKWALPAATKAAVEEAFPNACINQCVLLEADGTFETTIQLSADDALVGTYGIATYAGGGAPANPAQETFEPIFFEQLFPDVPQDHPFFEAISWLSEEGIANGFEDGFFHGDWNITRQAVGAFLWRMAGEPTPPPGHPTFTDVPPGHPFYEPISWMAAVGITTGFPDDTFHPQDNVTREAVAAFLWRDADEPTPPEDHPTFTDVPPGHPFYEAISWLAAVGVTNGFPDDTFRPGAHITRQAMAAFLFRYAQLD